MSDTIFYKGAARILYNPDLEWKRWESVSWRELVDEEYIAINGWHDLGATKHGVAVFDYGEEKSVRVSFAEVTMERLKVLYKDFGVSQLAAMSMINEEIMCRRFFDCQYEGVLDDYDIRRIGECSAAPVGFLWMGHYSDSEVSNPPLEREYALV